MAGTCCPDALRQRRLMPVKKIRSGSWVHQRPWLNQSSGDQESCISIIKLLLATVHNKLWNPSICSQSLITKLSCVVCPAASLWTQMSKHVYPKISETNRYNFRIHSIQEWHAKLQLVHKIITGLLHGVKSLRKRLIMVSRWQKCSLKLVFLQQSRTMARGSKWQKGAIWVSWRIQKSTSSNVITKLKIHQRIRMSFYVWRNPQRYLTNWYAISRTRATRMIHLLKGLFCHRTLVATALQKN